ncbi:hypothetical protein LL255_07785 [Enterococcus hirae]|nr:hypothetical protein [Enterococcus hirae]
MALVSLIVTMLKNDKKK